MREFLDDVHKHMDDGYGRAQAHVKRQLPKRFYAKVGISKSGALFGVELDGRATKTPSRAPSLVPSRELARLMANEWEAQQTHIDASSMPVVRLVNSAIEGGVDATISLRAELIKYAGNDLLLYRAGTPQELVQIQEQHWDAVLAGLTHHFEIRFCPVVGIIHVEQPETTLDRLAASLEGTDHFVLSALVSIAGLTGSALLALALRHTLIDGEAAWAAAHVDEDYNARLWGADREALARRQKRHMEFAAAIRVLALVDKS